MAQGGNKADKHTNQQTQAQTNAGLNHIGQEAKRNGKPMIVERVSKLPVVSLAVAMSFSQYDRLKTSNVTVGEVMSRAESWAAYFWQKMAQPIVDKFHEPIEHVDKLACNTLDFVEEKLGSVKLPPAVDEIVSKYKEAGLPAAVAQVTSQVSQATKTVTAPILASSTPATS